MLVAEAKDYASLRWQQVGGRESTSRTQFRTQQETEEEDDDEDDVPTNTCTCAGWWSRFFNRLAASPSFQNCVLRFSLKLLGLLCRQRRVATAVGAGVLLARSPGWLLGDSSE